jgi:hypothetical protein
MTPPPPVAAAPAVRPRRTASPARRTPAPRRVSGPAKGRSAARAAAGVAPRGGAVALPAQGGIALGLIEALRGIAKHRWLDRLIAGRVWIALVAFALIGIVAMQLWVVKLGVGIGRALEHEGLLQRENATLSIEDARLSSGERVEQLAAARGMVVASPGALRFDASRGALDARLAAAALARDGQAKTGSSASSTDTGTSGTEAAASSAEAPAQAASTATTAAGATGTGTEAPESTTATSAGSAATAATPEGASASADGSGSEGAATTAPVAEGAAAAGGTGTGTGAAAAAAAAAGGGGGAATGESSSADTGAVGSDGGTQQAAPGG